MARATRVRPYRHAAVIPYSFALGRRPSVVAWRQAVDPESLFRWPAHEPVAPDFARQVRNRLLFALRAQMDALLDEPTWVHLEKDWHTVASARERERLTLLLREVSPRPLERVTYREVKWAFKRPFGEVLALLARLEALYWTAPPEGSPDTDPPLPAGRLTPEQDFTFGPGPIAVTDELRHRIDAVLALPWLGGVRANDLRFATGAPDGLQAWFERQREAILVAHFLPELLDVVFVADGMTVREEFVDLAWAATRVPGRTAVNLASDAQRAARSVGIFVARHLRAARPQRAYAAIGREHGVSYEQVRLICRAFEAVLDAHALALPALDRALRMLHGLAPLPLAVADRKMSAWLGEDIDVEVLLRWARIVRRMPRLMVTRGKLPMVVWLDAGNAA